MATSILPPATETPETETVALPALRKVADPNTVTLSYEQVEQLGRDLDEIKARVVADLGSKDREYLYSIIRTQRGLEFAGRALLFLGFFPPACRRCRRPVGLEDPRQHGDRPQRHARPVRLDA